MVVPSQVLVQSQCRIHSPSPAWPHMHSQAPPALCHLPTKRLSPISRRGMAARPQTSRKSSNGPVLPTALNRGSLSPKLGCFIPAKNTETPQGTAPASPSSLAGGFLPFSLASSHPLSPYLIPVLLHLRHPSRPSLHKAGLLI